MDDHIKNLELKIAEQNKRLDEHNKQFMEMMTIMRELRAIKDTGAPSDSPRTTGNQLRPLGFTPKLDFPKFDGTGTRVWVKKCCKYFLLCKIPDDQKVDLASLNMIDKAENWVLNYLANRKNVDWNIFVIDLSARFRDDNGADVVEKFNKLQHIDSLEKYIDEFEDLRALMLHNSPDMPDSYILESFIGGLKPSIKPFVKAFKPASIASAIEFARLQEETLKVTGIKPSLWSARSGPPVLANTKPPLLPTPDKLSDSTKLPQKPAKTFRHIPAEVRAEKMAKGLCYYCDKPYDRSHKCQFKEAQLFTVEIPGQVEIWEPDLCEVDLAGEETLAEPQISVNALTGNHGFHTMRVRGMCNGVVLQILIDSGSTHNFLDINIAKQLGCKIQGIPPQAVSVADGNHLACQSMSKDFQWLFQKECFTTDVLLIPLGSCDMVLGIQWLKTLGSIKWDFTKLEMVFNVQGHEMVLTGISPQKLKVLKGVPSDKVFKNAAHLCFLQLK